MTIPEYVQFILKHSPPRAELVLMADALRDGFDMKRRWMGQLQDRWHLEQLPSGQLKQLQNGRSLESLERGAVSAARRCLDADLDPADAQQLVALVLR